MKQKRVLRTQKSFSGRGILDALETCARNGLTASNSTLWVQDTSKLESKWVIRKK